MLGRMGCLVAALGLLLASTVAGQSYNYGFDIDKLVRRQTNDRYVVKGLGRINGSFPVRQEVRQLQEDQDKWDLYLLGSSMMQYTDQSQQLSWYQIAGIHGVPWQSWGGVEAANGNTTNNGYCQHISILFPTWHRAYLALFEQVLYDLIQKIAALYPEGEPRKRYQSAAADFRIPYLDWAANPPQNEGLLPFSIGGRPTVNVSGPAGVQEISNPLYTYQFKPLNSTIFIEHPYDLWPTTVRSPTANDSSAGSNMSRVAAALDQNRVSFQQRTYNLFSNYKNYSAFSNEGWYPQDAQADLNKYDSLESLHDTIHILSGLDGHMTYVPFSAFDPLFFLHHCMVDRIFALWQVLNPDAWIVPTKAPMATYTTTEGQILNSTTPLAPMFASNDGTFWDSDGVRDPAVFGYTYPEISASALSGGRVDRAAQAQVMQAINRMYGSSSPASIALANSPKTVMRGRQIPDIEMTAMKASDALPQPGDNAVQRDYWIGIGGKRPPGSIIVGNKYWEWVANVHVEKQALDQSFSIHLFLGYPPTDSQTWPYAANLVGTMSVFASPAFAGMAMSGKYMSGTIPLTAALVKKVDERWILGLEPEVMQPYLRENLEYRIVRAGGAVISASEVPTLAIQITSSPVVAPSTREQLPEWGEPVRHFDLILTS